MVWRRLPLVLAAAAVSAVVSCAPGREASAAGGTEALTIATEKGDVKLTVEIADTDEERRVGLMYRASLPQNGGMLFDFTHEKRAQSMWMKNTIIPLDMAFIAADGRIVRIAAMTTPRSLASISSGEPVSAVLEVAGGRLEALGVDEGDMVTHRYFKAD